jgi:hypothetical protein
MYSSPFSACHTQLARFRVSPVDTSGKENETADTTLVNVLPPIDGESNSDRKGVAAGKLNFRVNNDIIECFVGIGTEIAVRHSEWWAGWRRWDVWHGMKVAVGIHSGW